MTYQEVVATLHAAPFQPFTMHLADGRSAHVPHPDFMAVSPAGLAVVISEDGRYHRSIDLQLVTEVEIEQTQLETR